MQKHELKVPVDCPMLGGNVEQHEAIHAEIGMDLKKLTHKVDSLDEFIRGNGHFAIRSDNKRTFGTFSFKGKKWFAIAVALLAVVLSNTASSIQDVMVLISKFG